jgi:integrase
MSIKQILFTLREYSVLHPKKKQHELTVPNLPNVSVIGYPSGRYRVNVKLKCPRTLKKRRYDVGDPTIVPEYRILSEVDRITVLVNQGIDPHASEQTVSEYFYSTFADDARPRKKSWKSDKSRFESRIKAVLGDYKLSEVTPCHLQQFVTSQSDLSAASRNRQIALLKKMFSFAVELGFLSSSPAASLRLFKECNAGRHVLNNAEVVALNDALDRCGNINIAVLVRLLMLTGMRLGEALRLQWRDIDLDNRYAMLFVTKNAKQRAVPLSDLAIALLTEHRHRNIDAIWLFPSPVNAGKPLSNPYKTLHAIRKDAGLTNWTAHSCRTWFASCAINNGASLMEVSASLGHSSIAITQKNYAFVSAVALRSVSNIVSTQYQSIPLEA